MGRIKGSESFHSLRKISPRGRNDNESELGVPFGFAQGMLCGRNIRIRERCRGVLRYARWWRRNPTVGSGVPKDSAEKPLGMLRRAQHERKILNVINPLPVRPEALEG